MFSGHASYYALIVLFFLYFSKNMNEKILVIIYSILGTIAVIAGRLHYSADVFVALFITTLSFYTFRYFCLTYPFKTLNYVQSINKLIINCNRHYSYSLLDILI